MDISNRLNRIAAGSLQVALMALVAMAGLVSHAAQAQVKLESSIKKVQTVVNDDGEVERRLVDAGSVVPGDELQYTVSFTNEGEMPVDAGTIVITDKIPEHTQYLDGTAFGAGTEVEFSVDGELFASPANLVVTSEGASALASAKDYKSIRWTFGPALKPGATGHVSFNVRLQ